MNAKVSSHEALTDPAETLPDSFGARSHCARAARQRLKPNVRIAVMGSSHQAWMFDRTSQNVTTMATPIEAAIVQSSPMMKSYKNLKNAMM